ncbi:MAG: hypothetical protein ACRD3V_18550 [Vicinamibacteria bacterium]
MRTAALALIGLVTGSIATGREHYLGLVAGAALQLIEERYLLDEDLPEILESAARHWDYLAEKK